MRVLLVNDDGVSSEGLRSLATAFGKTAEVFVVAPETEQSGVSHAISLHRPVRIRLVRPGWHAVDGTPTDCVVLAINHLLKETPPDLLVSGVNNGANLGDDVTYSGTVAAAMEGTLRGVPSMAVSVTRRDCRDFEPAAEFATALAPVLLSHPLPRDTFLNVNVPPGPVRGYAFTRQGRHSYGTEVVEKIDPRCRKYYWIGGGEARHEDIPGSDCTVTLERGLVSVTPLCLDLTAQDVLRNMGAWCVEGFERVENP